MKNKDIAQYSIVSWVVMVVAMLSGGETVEGFAMFAYYLSVIGVYVFGIWGLVRLYKSND